MNEALDVTLIGGGMITGDLILPALYQLKRQGIVGNIDICSLNSGPLKALAAGKEIAEAFPGMGFQAHPALSEPADKPFPNLYREVLAKAKPRQAAVVAVPDQLHYETVKAALEHDQHVLCVKPLVLTHEHAKEIEKTALERGLFVGVEYHKRFDRRSLVAKRAYGLGQFGEFILGEAKLIEPYYYRHSNFQNWFTVDKTDPFVYIGCHYIDLVYFITGLKPVEVSVQGVEKKFPNGKAGYLWSLARVKWENGALLAVTNGLGYPDDAAGSNDQGLIMFCEGNDKSGMIRHDDHDRGVSYSYLEGIGPGGSRFNYVSPDFFRYVPWEGEGYKPIGYGVDSVSAIIGSMREVEAAAEGLSGEASLAKRREAIRRIDEKGIIATPANSSINELVVEAARLSIREDGRPAVIRYGERPEVSLR